QDKHCQSTNLICSVFHARNHNPPCPFCSSSIPRRPFSPRRHRDTEECESMLISRCFEELRRPSLPVILSDSEPASATRGGLEKSRERWGFPCSVRDFSRCLDSLLFLPRGTRPPTPEINDLSFATPGWRMISRLFPGWRMISRLFPGWAAGYPWAKKAG